MHDRDIFFFCIQVCLFVAGIGIAFFRDNETGSHLDACAAKRQIVKDILMGVDVDKRQSEYNKTQPNVKLVGSYDSSGTLMTQIEEGASLSLIHI